VKDLNRGSDDIRELELGDSKRSRDDGSSTAHVSPHQLHASAGLQADSSSVEGDTLANKGKRLSVLVSSTLVVADRRLVYDYDNELGDSSHFQELGWF
jgi:hypothetical protein